MLVQRAKAMVYNTHGNPLKVLKLQTIDLPSLADDQLLLEFQAAPINPSDINQIQGVYPIRPELPSAIGGNEGVAKVLQVGKSLDPSIWKPGQLVIPSAACFGTWRTHAVASPGQLQRLPDGIGLAAAATISVNVFSAYRMLKDFGCKKGDVAIQNAANSGVGRAVIQLAKLWGIETINLVRNRENVQELVKTLKDLGADHVVLEEEMETAEKRAWFETNFKERISLALNCVGGASATNLARTLKTGGTLVTYGAMSRDPTNIPASLYIFKDLQCKGYWMARWKEQNQDSPEYHKMVQEVSELYLKGIFKEPECDLVSWNAEMSDQDLETAFLNALEKSQKPFNNRKEMLYMKH